MDKFSNFLIPKNIQEFNIYLENYYKQILRDELELMILKQKENDYFDIEIFRKKNDLSLEIVSKLLSEILEELTSLGWNWKLCYGNTGLYIYDKTPPPTIW